MNIQKLEALVTAIDLGSLSRAAGQLGYTQSGLTHMMNSLEAELGFALIRRGHFGIRPTEEGECILPRIRLLLDMERALSEDIRRIRAGEGGIIRIGACSAVLMHWLPSIISLFKRDHPDAVVELAQGSTAELYEGLENGRFDLILAEESERYPCRFIPLLEDRLHAVLPMGYPVDTKAPFPITGFQNQNFLVPGHGVANDIIELLHDHGVRPNVISALVDDPAILSMVAHGLGISMLSGLSLRLHSEGVLCLPVEPDIRRRIGIAMAEGERPSEPLRRFINQARRFVESLDMEG